MGGSHDQLSNMRARPTSPTPSGRSPPIRRRNSSRAGTNLIDLMKYDVERPMRLIDITRLPLKTVEETPDGGVRIGALVPNSDLAYHPLIEKRYPLLSSAILAGRIAAIAQHGLDRRQPAAAHALLLFL